MTRSRPPAQPLKLFGVPLLIVRTAPAMRPGRPEPMLPPDHYGCDLGCERFTGTLAAVEEHECGAHALTGSIISFPKVCKPRYRNILAAENELALLLQDIVEPLQHPLSVLQKVRRHALASPSLVASEEMQLLESADRHHAQWQKSSTSK